MSGFSEFKESFKKDGDEEPKFAGGHLAKIKK